VKDKASKKPFAPEIGVSRLFEEEALKRGLVLYACTGCVEGVEGDMMQITPPLIITREQVDEMIKIMKETLDATEGQILH